MLQIVIDTNVLVAALRSKRGASYRLLRSIGDARWQANLSVPLLLEYEDVVKRPVSGISLSPREIDDILDFICAASNLREIFYLWRPVLPDPKDDFILELAVESASDFIVTYNLKDFAGAEKFGIRALTPQEFLSRLEEAS
ncbi:MAG TPA: putative toxin-antitoxin system toxin component, PIN family [Pyrinomonadaceae bacterium]